MGGIATPSLLLLRYVILSMIQVHIFEHPTPNRDRDRNLYCCRIYSTPYILTNARKLLLLHLLWQYSITLKGAV